MTNEPAAMKEIHEIRIGLYEETKGLSPEQRAERTREAARAFEEKHGVVFRRPSVQARE